MIKVKFLSERISGFSEDLAKIINDFVSDKKVIDIKYNAISDLSHNIKNSVMIIYEDDTSEKTK